MSDMWCATCGLLTTACRCSQLERCAECNGVIVEGFCDCDDVREDFDDDDEDDEDDGCDCVFCREDRGEEDDFDDNFDDDCDDPDCEICG